MSVQLIQHFDRNHWQASNPVYSLDSWAIDNTTQPLHTSLTSFREMCFYEHYFFFKLFIWFILPLAKSAYQKLTKSTMRIWWPSLTSYIHLFQHGLWKCKKAKTKNKKKTTAHLNYYVNDKICILYFCNSKCLYSFVQFHHYTVFFCH